MKSNTISWHFISRLFYVVANELCRRDYIYLDAHIILVKREKLLLELKL